jgi:NNP family nitrate/nitrite transporter-like MFS transporter
MSFLYIGTFGSFVGYAAALPLLLKTQFPELTGNFAFLGALVGAIARPYGGKLADRLGGAVVTLWTFVVMGAAACAVLLAVQRHQPVGFLLAFLVLFVTTGIGNGSTFRMIPAIFRNEALERLGDPAQSDDESRAVAVAQSKKESAAVLGISSAIGALGGYFIPRAFGASIKTTGGPSAALSWFVVFYMACVLTTWWVYLRPAQRRAVAQSAFAERTEEA